jgi:DNA-binding SARP family transcriptional activator
VVGDRRRRTEPHWIGGQKLRIFTLGRTRVESGEGPLAGGWLGHRPGQILKFLVANRAQTVTTEELIEVFWPQGGRSAPTSVRQAVHTLRDHLEPARNGSGAFIASRGGGYEIEAASVWIDADDFEESVRTGLSAQAERDQETAEAALTRAAGLYRGDFLSDEPYAEWALSERDRMRELAGQALRALAQVKTDQGDLEGATEPLYRLAELEPLDADVHRSLLGLLLQRGRQPEAARRYDLLKRRYQRTFGEGPPFSLTDL